MPTVRVDNQGTELFFVDSGPLPTDNYTTVVLLHGPIFDGGSFHRLLPLAASSNVRLVIVNRRDYSGSSKYSDIDLERLNTGCQSFMERLGLEIAQLLLWITAALKIPKISRDRRSGGVCLMGWSLGNATNLALLGYPGSITKQNYLLLQPYLRRFILGEPPDFAFNTPQSQGGLGSCGFADYSKTPFMNNTVPEDLAMQCDLVAGMRSEWAMLGTMQPVLTQLAERALFDELHATRILPELKVAIIAGSPVGQTSMRGGCQLLKQYKHHMGQGQKIRPMKFFEIDGANNFVYWEDPQRFWSTILEAIYS